MGFEVIDSRGQVSAGAPGRGPASGDRPREVVDLEASPDPGHQPPTPTPSTARPRRHRVRVLVVAAVVAAGLAGSVLGRHSAIAATDAQADATLAVAAQAVGAMPFAQPIGLGAELDVTVSNLGPRTVWVGQALPPSPGTRVSTVTVLGADRVPPGGRVQVRVRTAMDCRMGRVLTPRIGVRTADGVQHTTAVTMPDGGRPGDRLCPQRGGSSALSATLVGTVLLPAVQLANLTDDPLRVSLPDQGLYPYREGRVLEVVTRPSLPTTIRPHDRLTVRLRLVPHGCRAELQDVQRLDLARMTVAGTALRDGGLEPAGHVDVDVTALVSAAMVRSCG